MAGWGARPAQLGLEARAASVALMAARDFQGTQAGKARRDETAAPVLTEQSGSTGGSLVRDSVR